jgi:hypothetical protein
MKHYINECNFMENAKTVNVLININVSKNVLKATKIQKHCTCLTQRPLSLKP